VGVQLANGLAEAHQGPLAETIYRRLLQLYPDNFLVLNGLAYLYADVLNTHLDDAERMSLKSLEKPPETMPVVDRLEWAEMRGAMLDTLAWVYYKRGRLKEAYPTQQQAIVLTGNDPGTRYHMGAIEEAMGHIPAAREEYGMALRLEPRMAEARQALKRLESRAPGPAPPPSPGRATGAAARTPG
jgi:tetratricopeptide (TPR) repeat protein